MERNEKNESEEPANESTKNYIKRCGICQSRRRV